jgi:hypothetical protein
MSSSTKRLNYRFLLIGIASAVKRFELRRSFCDLRASDSMSADVTWQPVQPEQKAIVSAPTY